MYVGRILQGISGSGAWIIGLAMITDVAGAKNTGKALGFSGSFITAGILTGPTVAGVLLELLGYWPAWSVPLTLLAICLIARLAMVEGQTTSKSKHDSVPAYIDSGRVRDEDTALLRGEPADGNHAAQEVTPKPTRGFYNLMFRKGSAYAAVLNVVGFAIIVSGFDATLPIHLRDAFGWTSAPVGSIFLALPIPGMFLAPLIGWLRDRVGLRWPTSIGWVSYNNS